VTISGTGMDAVTAVLSGARGVAVAHLVVVKALLAAPGQLAQLHGPV
jgi:hypothetical protein